MATLTCRLRNPNGDTDLPVTLAVRILTTDGSITDKATHRYLAGVDYIEPGTDTYTAPDLTDADIVPAGAVYEIETLTSGTLAGRVWYWDGHADAFLDDLDTAPSDTVPGLVQMQPYDDTDLRALLGAKVNSSTYTTGLTDALATASADATTKANTARDAAKTASVAKAGDTMTGLLTLSGDPTNVLHAATRQWVLARIADLTAGSPTELDTFLEAFGHWQTTESEIGTLTTLIAGKQASDADLDAIAGLATQPLGRSLLTAIDHAALVALLQLTKSDVGLGNVSNLSPTGLAADSALIAAFRPITYTLAARPTATGSKVVIWVSDVSGGQLQQDTAAGVWTPLAPGVSQGALALVASATRTSTFTTASTTAVDVTGLSVTFTAVAGATYEVRAKVFLGNTVTATSSTASLTDGAGTVLDTGGYITRSANDSLITPLETEVTPGAGAFTYKLRLKAAAGTAFVLGDPTFPARLKVSRVA
jgi:hypothetical protein